MTVVPQGAAPDAGSPAAAEPPEAAEPPAAAEPPEAAAAPAAPAQPEAAAAPAQPAISTVVFDLGGVLIEWEPRRLYRKLFADDETMEWFLAEVCSHEWNAALDAGRPWPQAVAELQARYPDWAEFIAAYDDRWFEMLGEELSGTVEILRELRAAGVRLLALSNWSSEKFALARPHYPFLEWFEAIVISGDVGVAKPDPAIFRLFIERTEIDPGRTVYTDDAPANVAAAQDAGMLAVAFAGPDDLRAHLRALGLPLAAGPTA